MTDGESENQTQQELAYWFVHEDTWLPDRRQISAKLVETAYQEMGLEQAREVRDELTEAIERMENER